VETSSDAGVSSQGRLGRRTFCQFSDHDLNQLDCGTLCKSLYDEKSTRVGVIFPVIFIVFIVGTTRKDHIVLIGVADS